MTEQTSEGGRHMSNHPGLEVIGPNDEMHQSCIGSTSRMTARVRTSGAQMAL